MTGVQTCALPIEALGDQQRAEQLLTNLPPRTSAPGATTQPLLVAASAAKRPYGPEQALGPRDTPNPGDQSTAWASSTPDGQDEWLLVEFPQAVVPTSVKVYENCAPGALSKVTVFKSDGTEVDAWSGTDPTPTNQPSGVSVIPISVNFKAKRVKLYIDSKAVPGFNEIDAVGLIDASGNLQWASAAAASSTYGQPSQTVYVLGLSPQMVQTGVVSGSFSYPVVNRPNWGLEQVTGPPDTHEAGDRPTAWTSATPDGQDEWLQLEYANAVVPQSVKIYESFNPGAVTKLSVFREDGTEVEAWSGTDPTPRGRPKGVSVIPIHVDFKTRRVKLYINSKDVSGWNEFDAVGLVDESGRTQWATSAAASTTYGQQTSLVSGQPLPTNLVLMESLQKKYEQTVEEKRISEKKLEEEIRRLTEENRRLREQLKEREKKGTDPR